MNATSAIASSGAHLTDPGLRGVISVKVARTAMDNAKAEGNAMVALIDAAAPRAAISARPSQTETGQTLDLIA